MAGHYKSLTSVTTIMYRNIFRLRNSVVTESRIKRSIEWL